MKGPETELRSCSLSPCLPWNLALLFHSRQIQKAPCPSQLPCSWNKLLNVTQFSRSVSPMATVLPNPLVVSLQSPDPISQQRLAVDGSLS